MERGVPDGLVPIRSAGQTRRRPVRQREGLVAEDAPTFGAPFRITMMFHPSHHVTDLDEAESFFERVFGRPSVRLAHLLRDSPPREGHRTDYSIFTSIADVLFDSIDPTRNIVGGVQIYPTEPEPHLRTFGWYVDGIDEAYRTLRREGIRVTSQTDEPAEGDDPPKAGGVMPMFFTVPDDAGHRYQFLPVNQSPMDPRTTPGWSLPPVSDDDPLGIERCSHHTVLTDRPDRARRFAVDVLGGVVIHEGRNEAVGASSTYVHLGDSVLELAVPDSGTAAYSDWSTRGPNDTYHSLTWKVADLGRAERHLTSTGVRIRTRTEDEIITETATGLGIPWGFTTTLTPGDPRTDAR
jgi:catechol 2,3-dioxygenase-like lactoylglutathione lyase family enzyme